MYRNEVNKTKIRETAVLVLPMGVIYGVHRCNGLGWDDIHTKFHEDSFGHSVNIKIITSTFWGAVIMVLLTGRIYGLCRWDNLRCHNMCIPKFMTIDSGIQVILRVLPQQFERL
jgi:hypothetical protein